jgi:hypothetical protein
MSKPSKTFIAVAVIATIALSVDVLVRDQAPPVEVPAATQNAPAAVEDEPVASGRSQVRDFTAEEFKDLVNGLSLPNTTPLAEPPAITGNPGADAVIAGLAEARGYELRSLPSSQLSTHMGVELQPLLIGDWEELAAAAKRAGHEIRLRSGYRSIADQRELFLAQLRSSGITDQQIASGAADQALNDIMALTAPPGYSRHHHGYTIDVYEPTAAVFEYSDSYAWLKAANFANAKKYGFVPSYPEGAGPQGPEPEAWEFVWANKNFVLE